MLFRSLCSLIMGSDGMNYVMNWIQQDDSNLLHNMRDKIACKFIGMLKIDCFARKNECTDALPALHTNNWLNGRIFHNSRIFLQNINIGDRIRFKTAQYCRFVSKF